MDAKQVFGIVFPFVLAIIIAALIVGARSSGRERTRASVFELRLRETVFTGPSTPSWSGRANAVARRWPRRCGSGTCTATS